MDQVGLIKQGFEKKVLLNREMLDSQLFQKDTFWNNFNGKESFLILNVDNFYFLKNL